MKFNQRIMNAPLQDLFSDQLPCVPCTTAAPSMLAEACECSKEAVASVYVPHSSIAQYPNISQCRSSFKSSFKREFLFQAEFPVAA